MNLNDDALKHSSACIALLDGGNLKDALAYCASQRIDPPQCSLTAVSANAENLRLKAMNQLADYGWWLKRLKVRANRDAEMQRMKQLHQA